MNPNFGVFIIKNDSFLENNEVGEKKTFLHLTKVSYPPSRKHLSIYHCMDSTL